MISLLALSLFTFFADETPSANQLIRAAVAAQQAQDAHGWKFTFREDHENSQIDKHGRLSTPERKSYENIMLEGENYRKLILVNGQPLDPKLQKKVDEDLEKERTARRSRKLGKFHRSISIGGLETLEQLFDNKVTGMETVSGRPARRVESQPKAGYKPANKEEEEALCSRHVNWFDREEGVRIKEQVVLLRNRNSFQSGSEWIWEYSKVGDAWLVERATMRMEIKALALIHAKGEDRFHYYDYQKFTVESKVTTP